MGNINESKTMTDEELAGFADGALWYEIDMLFETIEILMSKKYDNDRIVHNSLVESFVIHARNLSEFLTASKLAWKDIVIAKLYCDDPMKWGPVAKQWRETTKQDFDCERANRAVAHLSVDRLKYNAVKEFKGWDCIAIGKGLYAKLKIFLTFASNLKLSNEFRNRINTLESKFTFLGVGVQPLVKGTFVSPATVAQSDLETVVNTVSSTSNTFSGNNVK